MGRTQNRWRVVDSHRKRDYGRRDGEERFCDTIHANAAGASLSMFGSEFHRSVWDRGAALDCYESRDYTQFYTYLAKAAGKHDFDLDEHQQGSS